jgi:hypothetical protein
MGQAIGQVIFGLSFAAENGVEDLGEGGQKLSTEIHDAGEISIIDFFTAGLSQYL